MHINDGQNVQISEHVGIKWSMDNVVVIAPVTLILYLGLSLVFTAFIEKANSTISIMPAIYNSMVEGKGNTDGFLIVLLFFVGAFIAFGNIIAYLSKKKNVKYLLKERFTVIIVKKHVRIFRIMIYLTKR